MLNLALELKWQLLEGYNSLDARLTRIGRKWVNQIFAKFYIPTYAKVNLKNAHIYSQHFITV